MLIDDLSPEKYFGFEIGTEGKMIKYSDMVSYFKSLQSVSKNIVVENLGVTDGGNEYIAVLVSDSKNLENLEYYAEVSHQLADMKDYDEKTADELSKSGKAIFINTMSIHSHEYMGGQTSVKIVYDLLTEQNDTTKQVLENVIYILFPSVNPDGQDIVWNFYDKYKDTKFNKQGCCINYHKFACHANNRDLFAEQFMETSKVNEFTYRRFHATACYDVHHMQETNHRFLLSAPGSDPRREEISSLLTHELAYYGSSIMCEIDKADCKGAVNSYWEFADEGYWSLFQTPKLHNIISILNENAHPYCGLYGKEMKKEELTLSYKGFVPSVTNPNPWEGGYWGPKDLAKQIYTGVNAFLYEVAKNKNEILKNTAIKAAKQTERGLLSPIKGYLINAKQKSAISLKQFLNILENHRIDYYCIKNHSSFYENSYYVPLAQPNYAMISVLFSKRIVPNNRFSRNIDGYNYANDGSYNLPSTASANLAEWMGLDYQNTTFSIPAEELLPKDKIELKTDDELPLSIDDINSIKIVNTYLKDNKDVYFDGETFTANKSKYHLRQKKIALFMMRTFGSDESSFTNFTLNRFGFDYKIVGGHEIREGALKDIDVLIFPGQNSRLLEVDDYLSEDRAIEHQHAMGPKVAEIIGEFVNSGGEVVTWNASCDYFIRYLNLPIVDEVTNLPRNKYQVHFSTLNIHKGSNSMITNGLKQNETFVFGDSSAFNVLSHNNVKELLYIDESNILNSGVLVGEDFIKNKPCALEITCGEGRFIMYGFDPQLMSITYPQMKLLFNTLYFYET